MTLRALPAEGLTPEAPLRAKGWFDDVREGVVLAFSTLSDAAVWAGLYVTGALVCFAQVAGLDVQTGGRSRAVAAAFAFCTGMAVYLLDRIKLHDAWLDPADAAAHPRRFGFLKGNAQGVRGLIGVLLVGAGWLGSLLAWWGVAVPLIAVVGVLVYAGRPRGVRARPKDIVVLKNMYVALGITGFAAIIAIAAVEPASELTGLATFASRHAALLLLSGAHLVLRVLADAVLCDLDDEAADRRFGTGTLPTHMGRERAWNVAMALRIGSAAALVPMWGLPLWPRLGWAGVTVISSVALRMAAPTRIRDWVDARLALEAAAVGVLLVLFG